LTTGIDLVAVGNKIFQYTPIPNDPMISNTTTQNGTLGYVALASSVFQSNDEYRAFDENNSTYWHSQVFPQFAYDTNGIYIGGGSIDNFFKTQVSSQSISGEWLQIKLPYKIILKTFDIQNRSGDIKRYPKIFTIAGSNDGTTWNNITTVSLTDNPDTGNSNINNYLTSSNNTEYLYFRLIVQNLFTGNVVNLNSIRLNGYENGKIYT
jgi:hypothetical protein